MERPRILTPWIRRGLEAGVFGGILSYGSLIAYHFSRPAPRFALPQGIDGAMILLPAVLALAVFAVGYPTFLAATRADAIMGSIAAFLIAADLLVAVSFALGDNVFVRVFGRSMPLGAVAVGWALPVAVISLAFGQLSTPLGFGRSAAFRAAAAGFVLAVIAVLAAAKFTSAQ